MADSGNSDMPAAERHGLKSFLQRDLWLFAVLACFTLFAWANWGKMTYPIIDVGREIEIPARLVTGQVLYRDVETYYGPLGYYTNALALLLFGHRLEVFYAVGLVLALAATLLFYRLAKRLTNGRWATLSTVCMLIYCALGPGIFNFILPYSTGSVYATVLCLLAITAVDRYAFTGRARWLVVAAIACGFAGIAKQEYGVAVLGGVLVGTNLCSPQNLRTRIGRSLLVLVVAGACAFLPLTLLAWQISWEKLYLSLFPISKFGVIKQSDLFQVSPAKTLYAWWATFKVFFAASLVIWVSMVAAHWIAKSKWINPPKWFRNLVEVLASVAFSLFGLTWLNQSSTFSYYPPMTIFHPLESLSWSLPLMVGWFALNRPKLMRYKHAPLLWTLLVFSLLLNARWLFYINFYGLYAAPVILLFFTLLYDLTQRAGGVVWRYLLICLLIGSTLKLIPLGQYRYAINSSSGTFYIPNATLARVFNQTINTINASKATSVLVLPEGNILNFLTATHSPSREITFLPVTFPTSKDEEEFLARMQANPPQMVVYVYRSFNEYGYQNYAEFNPLVDRWITQQHRLIQVFPMDKGAISIYTRD
jgi:4-amino-4-deoxy-L-arabinose transferase-like glycosyltransferase